MLNTIAKTENKIKIKIKADKKICLWATKLGKLALEHNSIKASKGGENTADDLLTMRTLKNTDAAIEFP